MPCVFFDKVTQSCSTTCKTDGCLAIDGVAFVVHGDLLVGETLLERPIPPFPIGGSAHHRRAGVFTAANDVVVGGVVLAAPLECHQPSTLCLGCVQEIGVAHHGGLSAAIRVRHDGQLLVADLRSEREVGGWFAAVFAHQGNPFHFSGYGVVAPKCDRYTLFKYIHRNSVLF